MKDNRDLILEFLSENRDRPFNQIDLKQKLFPELNKDQVKELLYQIIDFKPNLMRVYNESSIGILSIQYSGLIDDFISNGGFTKIESDFKSERVKELKRESKKDEIIDLDLKLKRFESKIGKKLILAGFIITFLSFAITVLTLEFSQTDDNKNEQKSRVEKPLPNNKESKPKDSLN